MSGTFIELQNAASMLGMTPDELNDMRRRSEIFGYRDGSTWKFKMEELERVADELGIQLGGAAPVGGEEPAPADDDLDNLYDLADLEPEDATSEDIEEADSILVSESELGQSDETTSSTIIGKNDQDDALGGSDLELIPDPTGESDVKLVASDSDVGIEDIEDNVGETPVPASEPEDALDVDLDLDEDLSLDAELELDIGDAEEVEEDDNLVLEDDDEDSVLGGSDITVSAADSGIALTNPADSGLSLDEEPLMLGDDLDDEGESFELEEDAMITLDDESEVEDPEGATQLQMDKEFSLPPGEDAFEDESDSGSQVIALDEEDFGEGLDDPLMGDQAEMLEPVEMDEMGAAPASAAGAGTVVIEAPETPYSVWNVLSLIAISFFLMFACFMMVDLLFHIHSWGGESTMSSPLLDYFRDAFGMK